MFRILTEEKNVEQVKAPLTGLGLDFTIFDPPGVRSKSQGLLARPCSRFAVSYAISCRRSWHGYQKVHHRSAPLFLASPMNSKLSPISFLLHLLLARKMLAVC